MPNHVIVDCGTPQPPTNGHLRDVPTLFGEGTTVTFQCNEGFNPPTQITTRCTASSTWDPLPAEHVCTIGKILLLPQ